MSSSTPPSSPPSNSGKPSLAFQLLLTPKQKKVLEFIQRFREKRGYSPSQQEIAQHFGFKSLGTVQDYLTRLEKQGALTRGPWNTRRGLVASSPSAEFPPQTLAEFNHLSTLNSSRSATVPLPILGRVAAGRPIEIPSADAALLASRSLENCVHVPAEWLSGNKSGTRSQIHSPAAAPHSATSSPHQLLQQQPTHPHPDRSTQGAHPVQSHFVLEVVGDSMIDDGIFEGDQVVIRRQSTAENGQTVVACLGHDREATIKRFYKRKGNVELHPANPRLQPMVLDGTHPFQIDGILVGLLRSFQGGFSK